MTSLTFNPIETTPSTYSLDTPRSGTRLTSAGGVKKSIGSQLDSFSRPATVGRRPRNTTDRVFSPYMIIDDADADETELEKEEADGKSEVCMAYDRLMNLSCQGDCSIFDF